LTARSRSRLTSTSPAEKPVELLGNIDILVEIRREKAVKVVSPFGIVAVKHAEQRETGSGLSNATGEGYVLPDLYGRQVAKGVVVPLCWVVTTKVHVQGRRLAVSVVTGLPLSYPGKFSSNPANKR
jgi:hypothetical protein